MKVLQIFHERYPKQVLYFVKVNTNGIVDKCSDLTCTKKYALTKGPKRIDRFTVVSRLFPFCPFSLFGWGLNCYWLLLCGCHFLGLVIANTFACFSVWFDNYNFWVVFPCVLENECDVLLAICLQGHQCDLFCEASFTCLQKFLLLLSFFSRKFLKVYLDH